MWYRKVYNYVRQGALQQTLETEVIQVIIKYRGRERQFHFHIHTGLITADRKLSDVGHINFCLSSMAVCALNRLIKQYTDQQKHTTLVIEIYFISLHVERYQTN